jgi:hypothetical protein
MRKHVLLSVVPLLTLFTLPAFAGPHRFGQQLSAAQCDPGPTSKMVLNVVFQVTGDADSGVGGYWAYDSYTKHVQVWDQFDGTYCARVTYNGSFVTVPGTSPAGSGSVAGGVTGTMGGGYTATIDGATFTPTTKRTKGSIGTKDFGCIISTGGVASGCNYYSWFADYFTGGTVVQNFWGWTYNAGDNGTWVNASTGNSGDITGS